MNYTVLDLFSSLKSVIVEDGHVRDFDNLDPLFVQVNNSSNKNKAPFAVNSDSINATEMIIIPDSNGFRVNYDHFHHISKMLAQFQYSVESTEGSRRFNISLDKPDDVEQIKKTELLMGQWYNYESKSKATLKTQNKRIVPIPDNYSAEAQDSIIRSLGGNNNVSLVYRPIAAFIALEEQLKAMNVNDGQRIQVLDYNNLGIARSELTVYREGSRLIPGRTEFERYETVSYSSSFNPFGCLKLKISSPPSKLNCYSRIDNGPNILGFDVVQNELKEVPVTSPSNSSRTLLAPEPGIITITIGRQAKDQLKNTPFIINCSDKELIRGAAICIDCIRCGITAYYDECKELNMAYQTKYEEIDIRTIVKPETKIRGGFPVPGLAPINDFSILASSPKVKFYILLGTKNRNLQLKVLEKEINQKQLLDLNIEKLPIRIQPSFTPGQGHPKFTVIVDKDKFPDFEPVEIDWYSISDAVFNVGTKIRGRISSKYSPIPITVNLLEETIDRSFPVDIPPVEYDNDKTRDFLERIECARTIKQFIAACKTINRSSWPYKNEDGMRRFTRTNTFGMPVNGKKCYDRIFEDRVLKFYDRLEYYYKSNLMDENTFLTTVAWTYNGERYSNILRYTLKEAENKGFTHGSIAQQKLTLCVNFITPNQKELSLRVFHAYKNRMDDNRGDISGAGHWLRIGYQLFQYNTTFLEEISLEDMYLLSISIGKYYEKIQKLKDKLKQSRYLLMTFLFALKHRRFYSNFLKATDSSKPEELLCLQSISEIIENEKKGNNKNVAECLESFLNGRGTLDIPLEDDIDD
jgi:hypothetical protein